MGHDLSVFMSKLIASQCLYSAECVFDIVFACVKRAVREFLKF